ncbi:MAG: Mrp/NBP35 family ATP-binding protein [Sphingomonadales bacterium]|nr:Mrp/NBP35 family ATP-binding protein [Sphingomonadales bacterium]
MTPSESIETAAARLSHGRSAAVRRTGSTISLVCDVSGLGEAERTALIAAITAGLRQFDGIADVRIAETSERRDLPVVAIASGKGGVGKSTIATNIAVALARSGRKVGMVDADIYGPSQPTLLGCGDDRPIARDKKLVPVACRHGIGLLSMGQLAKPGQAIAWRGPMAGNALTQLVDAHWGDTELLIADMPPGTGDVQLSMMQRHKPIGAVIVSTPQDLALIDARRAIGLFNQADVPIIGLVENMAGYACPHCGEISDPFGSGGAEAAARELGIAFLGRVPLTMTLREASDAGEPPAEGSGELSDTFADIAGRVARWVDERRGERATHPS